MNKKYLIISLIVLIFVAVLGMFGYLAMNNVKNNKSNQEQEAELAKTISQNATVEVKMSSDSTGFGIMQLDGDEQYSCYLIGDSKCSYVINTDMKLVAIPVDGSNFDGWINGCDNISATNLDNDTCEINAHSFKKIVEVKFAKP